MNWRLIKEGINVGASIRRHKEQRWQGQKTEGNNNICLSIKLQMKYIEIMGIRMRGNAAFTSCSHFEC